MQRPTIIDAPGIAWRERKHGWAALWVARRDLVKRGFRKGLSVSQHLYFFTAEPTEREMRFVQSECQRLQDEMLAWSRGDAAAAMTFDGTLAGLSRYYQRDPDSPFANARGNAAYVSHLIAIEREKGARALHALGARDFLRWYDEWSDDGRHIPRAHARMSMIRRLMGFGVTFELHKGQPIDHCLRLQTILSNMEFARGKVRTEALNLEQASAIIAKAYEMGEDEIALAQAFQFELGLRQKDVIGECLPMDHPGTSDVIVRDKKWLLGLRWDEIGADLWLTHRLSKSIRGRKALADPRAGKWKRWNLRVYPLIMTAIGRLPARPLSGPLIVDHKTGLPFAHDNVFRGRWRAVADAAGVPRHVQNRDSRAGKVTEAVEATDGNLEAVRKVIGHTEVGMTQRYSRDDEGAEAAVQRAVIAFRARKSDAE